jgi:hypothetical protein
MPVLHPCRNPKAISRPQVVRWSIHALHDTAPAESDEELLAGMGVPDGASARRKAHFVGPHAVIGSAENAGHVNRPHVAFRAAELEGRGRSKPRNRWSRHG